MSSQMGMKEVCLIDAGITNIGDLALTEDTETLNLHCNNISTISNLQHLSRLHHLDLSSNVISHISHLEGLTELRTLNLSCNLISEVSGLEDLRSLLHLNLSYNCISGLRGLCQLWGPEYYLKSLELQGNNVSSVEELIESLTGLTSLEELTLEREGSSNPVCQLNGYRTAILNSLPQLKVLDGRDRRGRLIQKEISLNDIPGLEQYLDFLVSSDGNTSASQDNPLQIVTPKIDQLLDKFRRGALRSDEQTSSNPTTSHSEMDLAGRSHQSKKFVSGERVSTADTNHEDRIMELEKKLNEMLQKSGEARTFPSATAVSSESTSLASRHRTQKGKQKNAAKRDTEPTDESENSDSLEKQTSGQLKKSKRKSSLKRGRIQRKNSSSEPQSDHSQKHRPREKSSPSERKGNLTTKSTVEQDSEKLALLQELEEERVRRWKAEQAAVKLADRIKTLQTEASEGREIQDVAVHATSRLKEVLMREKEHRLKLEKERDDLREKVEKLVGKLGETAESMERKDKALEAMETTAKRMESERLQQQAHEAKQLQEYQLKLGATSRELDLLRTQVKNSETKIQQLQELLANREQEHRNEVKHLYRLDSKELQEVLNQQLARERESHRKELSMNEEKIDQLSRQYAELEDEFRLALRLEADRFQQVHDAYEDLKQDTSRYRETAEVAINKEKRSSALVTELTTMVKEQKVRISELSKSKQDTAARSKEQIQSMETQLEEARKKLLHFEAVCQEKTRLQTQLVAQESVIDGLKAERKLWGQELAQQGSSLAQDRGRLEAKIEALTAEVASLKKQQVADNEGLKIKTKVIDDQTDTIRKLKEAVTDRDNQIKKVREESLEMQRSQEEIINTEQTANQDLKEQLEHLQERKDALKEQVQELQVELDESQRAYRALDRKWKDKGDLISQLEEQVRQVKKTFDEKEAKLKMERDKALEQERSAKERVQTLDNAFRKQMEAAQQGFDESMDRLRQEKDSEIEEANRKIMQVEDEMRHLLSESAHQKKVMEEKLKRVTKVFSDLQQDLG